MTKITFFLRIALVGCLLTALARAESTYAAPLSPAAILSSMQQVADWQLAHAETNHPTGWICAVGDLGTMALAGISGDPKYREAMLAKGESVNWRLATAKSRQYHADDQCYGQVCAELYFLYREPGMIAPLRAQADWILAHPSTTPSLDFKQPGHGQELWSWCDSLFMAPPAWLRLYDATGDSRYLDFAVTNFWRTADYLYDPAEHLFFRDSTFFDRRENNGRKVFWSRGNGWVLGGLVRVLQSLPANHPARPRFEHLFKDMADKILSLQSADGFWRASLLDPEDYPTPEASGTALFTYGLAWGVNQGLLDPKKFEPAIAKAWPALTGCVDATGKLTHVQPAGDHPVKFSETASSPYGGGVFLLAGSEVYRMAVLAAAQPLTVPHNAPPGFPGHPGGLVKSERQKLKIQVTNPAPFRRECETVEINLTDLEQAGFVQGSEIAVMDGVSSRILDSQVYASTADQSPDKLLFQVDLAPGETRSFYLVNGAVLAALPPPLVKTMARYVPERFDDFAWENDRIAHRIYGLALIPAEGTISSGSDVWIKKDRGLIVDQMYASKHYHEDNGTFMDDYRVGKSRGCGGLGIWDGKKLFVSSNYRNWKLITRGPLRSEFELTYDAWDAGQGRKVSEVKRMSIDAGSWLTRVTSTLTSDDPSPLTIGVGLAERACPTNRVEFVADNLKEGWLAYWQPEDKPKGTTAVAIALPKDSVQAFTNDNPALPASVKHGNVPQPTHEGYPPIRNLLAITMVTPGQPFTYYAGASWDRSGDFTNHLQWEAYVNRFAERRDQPLKVSIEK